jgi:hypothetical protein
MAPSLARRRGGYDKLLRKQRITKQRIEEEFRDSQSKRQWKVSNLSDLGLACDDKVLRKPQQTRVRSSMPSRRIGSC